jgi:DNA-binding MarR family transcriptional regulator
MEIEKEIKQTSFRNEYQKVLMNLVFSSNWLIEKIRRILDKEGVTHQQYNILRILRGSPSPLSTLQIRERMLDKMSDTSRIVERLIKKGLADKKLCPYDKRLVDVTLTAQGLELLDRLNTLNDEIDAVASALTTEEAKTLNTLLDKLREND